MRKSKEELNQHLGKMDYSGVDNLTEFLSKTGWKKVSDYEEGDMVLQYNKNGTANWVYPIEYRQFQNKKPFYEYSSTTMSSCQTGNHRVLYLENKELSKLKPYSKIQVLCDINGVVDKTSDIVLEQIMQSDIAGDTFSQEIPLAFEGVGGDYVIDRDLLTLIAYTFNHAEVLSEDDSYISVSHVKAGGQAELLENQLRRMGINYTRGVSLKTRKGNKFDQLTYEFVCGSLAYFYTNNCIKRVRSNGGYSLPTIFFELRKDLSLSFAESIVEWYWNTNGDRFVGNHGKDADIIQYHIQSNGLVAYISVAGKGSTSVILKDCKVGKYEIGKSRGWRKVIEESDKYCLVVPSHMLVLRRKGKIYITGDCISSEE